MKKLDWKHICLSCLLCILAFLPLSAGPLVYKVDLKENVNSSSFLQIKQGLAAATADSATHLLLHMNTYGGEVLYADSIRSLLLNAPMPVAVFIDRNAASAGALISIACDSIYMREGATIGASTVVNQSGEQAPDKYQSYMRAMIRATAEAQGRDPQIAEAMVDADVAVVGVSDSGKVLTFTAHEALQHHFCEAIVEDIPSIIEGRWQLQDYELKSYEFKTKDRLKGWLMNSSLRAILVMIIVAGIWFELQSPGIGFPFAASVIAAVLYFAPAYMDGLLANWELITFIVGMVLLAIELLVIPGFGIFGILGILGMMTGLCFALVGSDFSFSVDSPAWQEFTSSFILVVFSMILAVIICALLSARIGKGKGLFSRMALQNVQDAAEGYVAVKVDEMSLQVGKEGEAFTVLRPAGKVRINGKIYDAVAEFGFIEAQEKIVVIRSESGCLYVRSLSSKA